MPDWLEAASRSIFILIGLFIITKFFGKKQLSKLSFFEYIVGITVGDIAGSLSMDPGINLMSGVISLVIWSLIPILFSLVSLKNKKFRDLVEGSATIFIKNGKIMEENLKKEKFNIDGLLEQLRRKDVFNVADVEFATLETTGDLSVFLKKEKQPLTVGDIMTYPPQEKEPQTVVMDARILDEPLSTIGLNRGWLKGELDKIGVTIENVYMAQVDSYGEVTVDLYDDKVQVKQPQEKQLLLVNMRKTIADFESFALETESPEAKAMYQKNAEKMTNIVNRLIPYLSK